MDYDAEPDEDRLKALQRRGERKMNTTDPFRTIKIMHSLQRIFGHDDASADYLMSASINRNWTVHYTMDVWQEFEKD